MVDPLPNEQEELLRKVLIGDLPLESEEIQRLFREQPRAHERMKELSELTHRIDLAFAEQRSVLEAADRIESAPGQDRIAPAILAERARARRSPSSRAWLVLAAAAAGIAALTLLMPGLLDRSRRAANEHAPLGVKDEFVLSPNGPVERYEPFRWDLAPTLGTGFIVAVFDDTNQNRGRLIEQSPILNTSEWSPENSETLPVKIRWELRVTDAAGSLSVYSRWAWLSSR